jgi:hypothetical protein
MSCSSGGAWANPEPAANDSTAAAISQAEVDRKNLVIFIVMAMVGRLSIGGTRWNVLNNTICFLATTLKMPEAKLRDVPKNCLWRQFVSFIPQGEQ